jgi:hypothetical protein
MSLFSIYNKTLEEQYRIREGLANRAFSLVKKAPMAIAGFVIPAYVEYLGGEIAAKGLRKIHGDEVDKMIDRDISKLPPENAKEARRNIGRIRRGVRDNLERRGQRIVEARYFEAEKELTPLQQAKSKVVGIASKMGRDAGLSPTEISALEKKVRGKVNFLSSIDKVFAWIGEDASSIKEIINRFSPEPVAAAAATNAAADDAPEAAKAAAGSSNSSEDIIKVGAIPHTHDEYIERFRNRYSKKIDESFPLSTELRDFYKDGVYKQISENPRSEMHEELGKKVEALKKYKGDSARLQSEYTKLWKELDGILFKTHADSKEVAKKYFNSKRQEIVEEIESKVLEINRNNIIPNEDELSKWRKKIDAKGFKLADGDSPTDYARKFKKYKEYSTEYKKNLLAHASNYAKNLSLPDKYEEELKSMAKEAKDLAAENKMTAQQAEDLAKDIAAKKRELSSIHAEARAKIHKRFNDSGLPNGDDYKTLKSEKVKILDDLEEVYNAAIGSIEKNNGKGFKHLKNELDEKANSSVSEFSKKTLEFKNPGLSISQLEKNHPPGNNAAELLEKEAEDVLEFRKIKASEIDAIKNEIKKYRKQEEGVVLDLLVGIKTKDQRKIILNKIIDGFKLNFDNSEKIIKDAVGNQLQSLPKNNPEKAKEIIEIYVNKAKGQLDTAYSAAKKYAKAMSSIFSAINGISHKEITEKEIGTIWGLREKKKDLKDFIEKMYKDRNKLAPDDLGGKLLKSGYDSSIFDGQVDPPKRIQIPLSSQEQTLPSQPQAQPAQAQSQPQSRPQSQPKTQSKTQPAQVIDIESKRKQRAAAAVDPDPIPTTPRRSAPPKPTPPSPESSSSNWTGRVRGAGTQARRKSQSAQRAAANAAKAAGGQYIPPGGSIPGSGPIPNNPIPPSTPNPTPPGSRSTWKKFADAASRTFTTLKNPTRGGMIGAFAVGSLITIISNKIIKAYEKKYRVMTDSELKREITANLPIYIKGIPGAKTILTRAEVDPKFRARLIDEIFATVRPTILAPGQKAPIGKLADQLKGSQVAIKTGKTVNKVVENAATGTANYVAKKLLSGAIHHGSFGFIPREVSDSIVGGFKAFGKKSGGGGTLADYDEDELNIVASDGTVIGRSPVSKRDIRRAAAKKFDMLHKSDVKAMMGINHKKLSAYEQRLEDERMLERRIKSIPGSYNPMNPTLVDFLDKEILKDLNKLKSNNPQQYRTVVDSLRLSSNEHKARQKKYSEFKRSDKRDQRLLIMAIDGVEP